MVRLWIKVPDSKVVQINTSLVIIKLYDRPKYDSEIAYSV